MVSPQHFPTVMEADRWRGRQTFRSAGRRARDTHTTTHTATHTATHTLTAVNVDK